MRTDMIQSTGVPPFILLENYTAALLCYNYTRPNFNKTFDVSSAAPCSILASLESWWTEKHGANIDVEIIDMAAWK